MFPNFFIRTKFNENHVNVFIADKPLAMQFYFNLEPN